MTFILIFKMTINCYKFTVCVQSKQIPPYCRWCWICRKRHSTAAFTVTSLEPCISLFGCLESFLLIALVEVLPSRFSTGTCFKSKARHSFIFERIWAATFDWLNVTASFNNVSKLLSVSVSPTSSPYSCRVTSCSFWLRWGFCSKHCRNMSFECCSISNDGCKSPR